MWSDKSARKFLEARDQRQEALSGALLEGHPAIVFLSLNIPGANKKPAGSAALFSWALRELSGTFPRLSLLTRDCDALGNYLIASLTTDPLEAKQCCIGLEERRPSARLIDLDVYSGTGVQIDRASLDLPGRTCLICNQPAVECIRFKRHSFDEVIGKAHELLAHFQS